MTRHERIVQETCRVKNILAGHEGRKYEALIKIPIDIFSEVLSEVGPYNQDNVIMVGVLID